MNYTKKILFFLSLKFLSCIAMQELPMVHIQKAEDASQFAGQVVAYTPVVFICDRYTYKELKGPLIPSLRYAFISHDAMHHLKYNWMPVPEREKLEKGYDLCPLITANIQFMNHLLFTELLQKDTLLMRKVTAKEAARLLQVLNNKMAHFEDRYSFDSAQKVLKQLISNC